jgi:hypothetical protein
MLYNISYIGFFFIYKNLPTDIIKQSNQKRHGEKENECFALINVTKNFSILRCKLKTNPTQVLLNELPKINCFILHVIINIIDIYETN